jgi:hypothetical protein
VNSGIQVFTVPGSGLACSMTLSGLAFENVGYWPGSGNFYNDPSNLNRLSEIIGMDLNFFANSYYLDIITPCQAPVPGPTCTSTPTPTPTPTNTPTPTPTNTPTPTPTNTPTPTPTNTPTPTPT